jgi:hypothetical protein
MAQKIQVFAVVRFDSSLVQSSLEDINWDWAITVKEILPTREEAVREVERLNKLEAGKGSHYFWQTTRYFPQGRAGTPQPQ